ncbi:hypothetical protein AGIG_G25649, partial [Arapaima gigas]
SADVAVSAQTLQPICFRSNRPTESVFQAFPTRGLCSHLSCDWLRRAAFLPHPDVGTSQRCPHLDRGPPGGLNTFPVFRITAQEQGNDNLPATRPP